MPNKHLLPANIRFNTTVAYFALFTLAACSPSGPRDAFRSELAEDVEELVNKLSNFSPGTEKVEQTMVTGAGASTSEVDVPKAVIIGNRVKSLGKHFSKVSMELLLEDISTYDSWAALMKEDVLSYRQQIKIEMDKLSARIEKNPDAYTKPFLNSDNYYGGINSNSVYAPAHGFGLESLVIDEDGEIFFVSYGGKYQYTPKLLFQFDIDDWLEQVKTQSRSMQRID